MLAKVTFAVFAAFAFIKYCMQGKDDEEENESRVRREMSEAGVDQVERNKKRNGVLDYDYTCKLLNFLTITSRKRLTKERSEMLLMRREAYQSQDWDQYRLIVKFHFLEQDQMLQTVTQEALAVLRSDGDDSSTLTTTSIEQKYKQTLREMVKIPAYSQLLLAAQDGKLTKQQLFSSSSTTSSTVSSQSSTPANSA